MSQRNRPGQMTRLGTALAKAVVEGRQAEAQQLADRLLEREARFQKEGRK